MTCPAVVVADSTGGVQPTNASFGEDTFGVVGQCVGPRRRSCTLGPVQLQVSCCSHHHSILTAAAAAAAAAAVETEGEADGAHFTGQFVRCAEQHQVRCYYFFIKLRNNTRPSVLCLIHGILRRRIPPVGVRSWLGFYYMYFLADRRRWIALGAGWLVISTAVRWEVLGASPWRKLRKLLQAGPTLWPPQGPPGGQGAPESTAIGPRLPACGAPRGAHANRTTRGAGVRVGVYLRTPP